MRVLINETAMEVEKVVCVCEHRFNFNGKTERRIDTANKIDYANALAFLPAKAGIHDCFSMATHDAVMVCNLSNLTVKETLTSLTQLGYADLSDLKLQEEQPFPMKYIFDNGEKAGAYLVKGGEVTMALNQMCGGFPFIDVPAESDAYADDGEDAEENEDE